VSIMNTQAGEWFPRLFLCPYLGMPKNAFQLAAIVVIAQMALVFFVLLGCFSVVWIGRKFEADRCNGQNAGDLMSFIAAQSFALLAAEKATKH